MRNIYLLRHCRLDTGDDKPYFLSSTDIGLSELGRKQAGDLAAWFQDKNISNVYASRLKRSIETAGIIARAIGLKNVNVIQGLEELSCGAWEGLNFEEARAMDSDLYEKRGRRPDLYPPPGGEPYEDGLHRFMAAYRAVIDNSEGHIVLVCHASVNRLFLCNQKGIATKDIFTLSQPYGCINLIQLKRGKEVLVETGRMPVNYPDETYCRLLMRLKGTPPDVIAHCQAVAEKGAELCQGVNSAGGYSIDCGLVCSAALLHDIARAEPGHDKLGSRWLLKEGFEDVARIIEAHHDYDGVADENGFYPVNEKLLVYLADKLVYGVQHVTIEERFNQSRHKCVTEEQKAAHQRRYQVALTAWRSVMAVIKG